MGGVTSEVALLTADRVLTRATAKRLRNRDPNLPPASEASRKRPRKDISKVKVKPKVTVAPRSRMAHLEELPLEALLAIVARISTKDALALFRLSKRLHGRLSGEGAFWRMLCHKETFNDYSALKVGQTLINFGLALKKRCPQNVYRTYIHYIHLMLLIP